MTKTTQFDRLNEFASKYVNSITTIRTLVCAMKDFHLYLPYRILDFDDDTPLSTNWICDNLDTPITPIAIERFSDEPIFDILIDTV